MTGSTKPNKSTAGGAGPVLVGLAGGSGSGKTFFASALAHSLGPKRCSIVYQDSFYFDQSARFDRDGGSVNFDHPDAIDFSLLAKCLTALKANRAVQIPIYDFVTHSRKKETELVEPKPVIVVDGILIFHNSLVRELFDERVFFATPEDLRFRRRLARDVRERGRTPDGVREQFLKQVKPMHDTYVEPSKAHAHTCVHDGEAVDSFLKDYLAKFSQVAFVP